MQTYTSREVAQRLDLPLAVLRSRAKKAGLQPPFSRSQITNLRAVQADVEQLADQLGIETEVARQRANALRLPLTLKSAKQVASVRIAREAAEMLGISVTEFNTRAREAGVGRKASDNSVTYVYTVGEVRSLEKKFGKSDSNWTGKPSFRRYRIRGEDYFVAVTNDGRYTKGNWGWTSWKFIGEHRKKFFGHFRTRKEAEDAIGVKNLHSYETTNETDALRCQLWMTGKSVGEISSKLKHSVRNTHLFMHGRNCSDHTLEKIKKFLKRQTERVPTASSS